MKKIIPITALVFSILSGTAFAEVEITKKEFNPDTGMITIEGKSSAGEEISVLIPKNGVSRAELDKSLNGDDVIFARQVNGGENGTFSVEIALPDGYDDSVYDVFVGGSSAGVPQNVKVSAVSTAGYGEVIRFLNEKAASTESTAFGEFKTKLETEGWKCGFVSEQAMAKNDVLVKLLYNYAKNTHFSESDRNANYYAYAAAAAAEFFDEENSDAAEYFLKLCRFEDTDLTEKYFEYVNTDSSKEYFMSKLSDAESIAEVETSIKDAVILTAVRYADGVSGIKSLFEKYGKYMGANTSSAKLSDYTEIAGKSYGSVADLVKTFNAHVKSSNKGGGGSSGGSSGGNSGAFAPITGTGTATPNKLEIKFEDLNSVPWAYSAISRLYEKKIISGISETRFCPNDYVTREAFAKMLVSIKGTDSDGTENIFSDVQKDAWYAKYVNGAFLQGIVNGISENEFGIGREISREDMCVMTYNFLKSAGVEVKEGVLGFADEASFDEYSKAPVGALSGMGIVNGVGDNSFDPKGKATRAQATVIINNVLGLIEN